MLMLLSMVFIAMVDSLSTITILLCVGTLAVLWYYLIKYIKMNFTE